MPRFSFFRKDEAIDSHANAPVDNFGVNFIFERALRRMDVHAEQRKVQQDKFESHLTTYENENLVLELRLRKKTEDFDNLNEKCKALRVCILFFFETIDYSLETNKSGKNSKYLILFVTL